MADQPAVQGVSWTVQDRKGVVVMRLTTEGAQPLEISVDPQAAFDIGEQLARAAHTARFGEPLKSDMSYLQDQIRKRTTEDYRMFLVQRVTVMLNSLRNSPGWSNGRLAAEVVDTILTKVA
ncbi:MAG: hypothetical protein NUV34_00955 [Sulfuricaulis sp.]|nr:hypothetical protein [Sulfuricaulis sp.]